MGTSKKYLRLFTFAGVLILVSSLMLGLFNEARAVDMQFAESPDPDVSGTATFQVELTVPEGEHVPIEQVTAVVEQQNADRDDDIRKQKLGDAACQMSVDMDCQETADFVNEDDFSGVVDRMRVLSFQDGGGTDLTGYGYGYGYDGFDASRTGYGYDDGISSVAQENGYGYGYGYETGDTQGYDAGELGYGYGYGYSDGDLVITYEIDIDVSELDNEDQTGKSQHYLTLVANTGSDILGDLSSPDQSFTISTGGTPGGGGGGGGNNAIPVKTGLDRAFDVSQNERVKIISGFPDGFQSMLVKFNRDCNDCSISLTSHGANPPSGTDAMPTSFRAIEYFSIEVKNADGEVLEGYIDEGSLEFDIDQSDLDAGEDPDQVVLNHRTNPWGPEATELTSSADADPLQFNGTLSGFSEFATAVDTEPPAITNTGPTGEVATTTLTLSADFADNRGVDADSFELLVDGNPQTDATASEDGFTYQVSGLADGTHTVSATVSDTSGLTTTEEWTFEIVDEITNRPCNEVDLPTITSIEASQTDPVPMDATITVSYEEDAEYPVTAATLTIAGEDVDVMPSDGSFMADLADVTLDKGEEFTVEVTITDTGACTDSDSETFQAEGEPVDGDGDDDNNALVWIIVGLIVLAVIGVGAYFYMEEQ